MNFPVMEGCQAISRDMDNNSLMYNVGGQLGKTQTKGGNWRSLVFALQHVDYDVTGKPPILN